MLYSLRHFDLASSLKGVTTIDRVIEDDAYSLMPLVEKDRVLVLKVELEVLF